MPNAVSHAAVGMTWKLVKETFENAGEVVFCEITNSSVKTGERAEERGRQGRMSALQGERQGRVSALPPHHSVAC